ncbi:putative bifunctional diguanylate cyclase/phosphodiesterase [Argonema antarcticum]|uniref:putative bifunctional diguanylate cyclase/phosphodiesterase n=1 Tax=Argonema antarcticum TaxID=2942763 RepID=UPI002010DCFB|nr:EAL domain-containing protein [Argonema antarcticum]MCL1473440.1 EAL domain-containing protein [Argonema antarcticum A004/B2]
MLPLKSEPRSWGLQARLLVPISLVLAAAVSQSIFSNFSIARQAELLVNRRGVTVLEGIANSVQERRKSKEIVAELLASRKDLATAVKKGDKNALSQMLTPLQTKLKLGDIHIYDRNGGEILHLGEKLAPTIAAPLLKTALSGLTESTELVNGEALIVLASAPIKEPQGTIGVILVEARLKEKDLNPIDKSDGVELALLPQSIPIGSTLTQPDLRRLLDKSQLTGERLNKLNQDFARYNFHLTAKPLANNGLLVALVPTKDLVVASNQRNAIALIGSGVLIIAMLWFLLVLAQDIAKPLKVTIAATEDILRGNYHRRVASGKIHELNDLAAAINYLAQQLEIQLAELTHQAFHDPLTKLPNRALFMNELEQVLTGADRGRSSVAVLFLDLDGFKVINDSLGHKAGDQLLIGVSQRLKSCLRSVDTVARFGGDEFTILLKDITEQSDATYIAERIIEQLQTPFNLEKREVFISSSIGIALSNSGYERCDDLLRNADAAMYEAKKSGKSRYTLFKPDMDSRAFELLQLATDLRRAIERQEFRLFYQPVLQLDNGNIGEVEALIRWEHPRIGLISPAKFIPLAEETGLILPIGQWVLETACRQARDWQLEYPDNPPLVVGVNLSAKQFQQPQFVDKIAHILNETGLNPQSLKLEITESMMMEQGDTTIATLYRLKHLGLRLAIDDFGTGFSALSYLKRFPVDTLKIDRSFIKGLGHNREDTAIVHAVIAFAKALHLSVTAEGVETAEQLSQLRVLGCDRGQGYYFSEPLTADALELLINRHLDRFHAIEQSNCNCISHNDWAIA